MVTLQRHAQEIIHAVVVVIVVIAATVFALASHDHSGNLWIIDGSAIGYAAGRAGGAAGRGIRHGDPPNIHLE